MENQEQEENVIYVYNGYIGIGGHYDDIPQSSSQYPDSSATSSIPVDAGDKSVVTYTSCYQFRLRLYNSKDIFVSSHTWASDHSILLKL